MIVSFCMLWCIFCCILSLLRNQLLLLLRRDLVKVSILSFFVVIRVDGVEKILYLVVYYP